MQGAEGVSEIQLDQGLVGVGQVVLCPRKEMFLGFGLDGGQKAFASQAAEELTDGDGPDTTVGFGDSNQGSPSKGRSTSRAGAMGQEFKKGISRARHILPQSLVLGFALTCS